jgi:hypothetical protein
MTSIRSVVVHSVNPVSKSEMVKRMIGKTVDICLFVHAFANRYF